MRPRRDAKTTIMIVAEEILQVATLPDEERAGWFGHGDSRGNETKIRMERTFVITYGGLNDDNNWSLVQLEIEGVRAVTGFGTHRSRDCALSPPTAAAVLMHPETRSSKLIFSTFPTSRWASSEGVDAVCVLPGQVISFKGIFGAPESCAQMNVVYVLRLNRIQHHQPSSF